VRAPARSGFGSGLVGGLIIGVLGAVLAGLLTGVLPGDEDSGGSEEALETIEDNYFESVETERLEDASIRGMVDELRERFDDRFSHYFDAEQLEDFNAATSGRFDGVGLSVGEVPRGLRVADVFPDSPAEAAEIRRGDLIVAVDGKSIEGLPSEVSTGRIKGPEGTEVQLTVIPAAGGPARDLVLERADVRLPAVVGELRTAGGREVAHVRYGNFSEGSHGELRQTIERLERRGAKGLVLDLRGNGGGLFDEAVLSASVFVEDGPVVSTESRTQGDRSYEAVGDAIAALPTVVLVDRDTASAAEILAAALETYDLATVVGTRTFGKGTFQEVIPLTAGGALDLTIGRYLTAAGTSIAGEGIKPEMMVEDDPRTEPDEALDRALRALGAEL
jgi:carboxyl-terminal processing protease